MKIKIDDDIPMPTSKYQRYPWHDMKVGQSFYTTTKPKGMTNAKQGAERNGKKFLVRREGEGSRGWRYL